MYIKDRIYGIYAYAMINNMENKRKNETELDTGHLFV